jgi:hypothetical protein
MRGFPSSFCAPARPLFPHSPPRYQRVPAVRTIQKVKFTPQEDQELIRLVGEIGTKDWVQIANQLGSRNPRQCRERYKNYLDPSINHGEWSAAEDALLIQKYGELGPKWNAISKSFNDRSDNSLRNRWNLIGRHKFSPIDPQTLYLEPVVVSALRSGEAQSIVDMGIKSPSEVTPLPDIIPIATEPRPEFTGIFDLSRPSLGNESSVDKDPFDLWSILPCSDS